MRIGCLQFAPQVADVDRNLNKADAILDEADPGELDLLVLPELAFSGYNFKSLNHISPFLEDSNSGISSLWARTTALKYDCTVVVGYPEKVDPTLNWPTDPEYYNSAIVINGEGETVANYRKTHLYYTDETWALEGSQGFYKGRIPGLGRTAIGICMDLNPYKFEAPWNDFEFSQHALDSGARLVIVSMAWLTHDDPRSFNAILQEPDTDTLLYWVSRFEPVIRAESDEEVIVVFANRCGAEDEATYTGTSAVIGIRSGEIWVYGILGRGETELLVVDTDDAPYAKLVYRPETWLNQVDDLDDSQPDPATSEPATGLNTQLSDAPENKRQQTQLSAPVQAPPEERRQKASISGIKASDNRSSCEGHAPAYAASFRKDHGIGRSDSPTLHPPRALSPKLTASKLHLTIPSNQFMLQRYLESESPISNIGDLGKAASQLSFHDLNISSSVSSSQFQGLARNTSNLPQSYWSPSCQYTTKPKETSCTSRDDRRRPSTTAWEPVKFTDEEDRQSIRSDVSVWNNQPGRVPGIHSPRIMTAPPEIPLHNLPWSPEHQYHQGLTAQQHRKHSTQADGRQISSTSIASREDNQQGSPNKAMRNQSMSQIRKTASFSQDYANNRKHSKNRSQNHEYVRSSTAQGLGIEETYRGRRQSSHRRSRDRGRRSHSRQAISTEPVDLSQYALIEEYPSARCPVHGGHSPSGTRSRNQSGRRGRESSRAQDLASDAITSQPMRRNSSQIKSSKQDMKRRLSRSTLGTGTSISMTNPKHTNCEDYVNSAMASMLPAGKPVDTDNLLKREAYEQDKGPKTPKAMLFIQDTKPDHGNAEKVLTPLKCVEKGAGHVLTRPLSSIW